MSKKISIISTLIVSLIVSSITNFCVFAVDKPLTEQEKGAFITRDEFNIWQAGFIASLSELDTISTQKIYDNMQFYDMQYRFSPRYKTTEWLDEDGNPKPALEQEILKEKAKRGML